MTELRRRMQEELRLRKFSPQTIVARYKTRTVAALFSPQRLHGLDGRRPPGRDKPRYQCTRCKKEHS